MTAFVPKPDLPPPPGSVGLAGWMRQNLFSTPLNGFLTVVVVWLIGSTVWPLVHWAFVSGVFSGRTAADCRKGGACWLFVADRLVFFVYGFFPRAETWRVDVVFAVSAAVLAALVIPRVPRKPAIAAAAFVGLPLLVTVLMHGGIFGLAQVSTDQWGGLTLTLVLSVVGIVLALPFGILLALGRRSRMPTIRVMSVVFIEAWRGVPLISVLFMASVMLPLFLPETVHPSKVLRAMIGIVMFESAYMAEVVRGGLQAIPRGQYEAAGALGLGYWRTMVLIILPQALKLVIPGIVNTFIALFKDTTLVGIIGLFDLLATVQATIMDPAWPDVATEAYLFAGSVFWVFCFAMSRYSQSLERKLQTGHRRR